MILKRGGVSFGLLGEREGCCGEAMRRVGVEKLFEELATSNIAAMKDAGVKKVITTSPHCYATFKKDYLELGADFETWHATQIFWDLLKEEKITPKTSVNKKVVYHDPCTLGRQNGIYDEPRDILRSIPGLELVEIENFSREFALCCGGGSGGLWLDWPKEERMANLRVEQAADTGAQILAVACPYCLHMFEDSVKVLRLDLEVKDVSELLAESLKG
jgi:Fe-S oxidoreductase